MKRAACCLQRKRQLSTSTSSRLRFSTGRCRPLPFSLPFSPGRRRPLHFSSGRRQPLPFSLPFSPGRRRPAKSARWFHRARRIYFQINLKVEKGSRSTSTRLKKVYESFSHFSKYTSRKGLQHNWVLSINSWKWQHSLGISEFESL